MIWIDYSFVFIIGASALYGIMRGLVREALSLVAWVLALWVAVHFSPLLAQLLQTQIDQPMLRNMTAFLILFVGTLLTGSLIGFIIRSGLKKIGLGFLDRLGGLLFGVLRGCGIVMIAIYLTGLTPIKRESWWGKSMMIGPFEQMIMWMRS